MSLIVKQHAVGRSASNFSVAFDAPTLPGNTVRVTIQGSGSVPPAITSDSYGNVWEAVGPAIQIPNWGTEIEYQCRDIKGGPNHTLWIVGGSLTVMAREILEQDVSPVFISEQLAALHVDLRYLNTLCANGFTGPNP